MGDLITWLDTQGPENLESNLQQLPVRIAEDTGLSDSQKKMLKEMLVIIERLHDPEQFERLLKLVTSYLLNPDLMVSVPVSIPGLESVKIVPFTISYKDLVKMLLAKVKNRVTESTSESVLPKFKTVFINKREEEDKNGKFNVNPKDLNNVRINFAKRKKTNRSGNGGNAQNTDKGRIIRYSNEVGSTKKLQVLPTILNSIQRGNYCLENQKFNIQKSDFLFPEYEENMVYNIMLVLDASQSVSWVIPHIEKFVSYITSTVSNSRDRLGLVAFNNDLAQIYHHPTLNVKQVVGTINKLEAKGQTPLGDGLSLALQVLSAEQYKMPGMKNLIILISDCYPEPLEGGHKNLLEEPCYKLVISAVRKIHDDKIGLIIINPSDYATEKETWSKKLVDKIVSTTDTKYIKVKPEYKTSIFKEQKAIIAEEKLTEFYEAITDIKLR